MKVYILLCDFNTTNITFVAIDITQNLYHLFFFLHSMTDSGSTKFVSCLHMGNQEYIKFEGNFDNLDLTAHTYPTFLNLYQNQIRWRWRKKCKRKFDITSLHVILQVSERTVKKSITYIHHMMITSKAWPLTYFDPYLSS